jgi:hypothetical protein
MTYLIELELKSPLIINQNSLPLESLLSAAVNELTGKIQDEALNETTIHHETIANFKTYKASCAFFADDSFVTKETIVRSRRKEEMGPDFYEGKKMRVPKKAPKKPSENHPWFCNQGKGPYKTLLNDYRVINTNSLSWMAETDDPDRVIELLLSLGWIGKRRGQGFGEVGGASYRDVGDESPLINSLGKPRRVMPVEVFTSLFEHNLDGVVIAPSQSYAASAWGNEPILCVMPESDALKIIVSQDFDDLFGEE